MEHDRIQIQSIRNDSLGLVDGASQVSGGKFKKRQVLPIQTQRKEGGSLAAVDEKCRANTSRILQTDPESFGSIEVAELDWGNEKHIEAVDSPFDYIIGTDVVYAEHLLKTIRALAGPKTSILLGYEIRSPNVHEQMLEMWRNNFNMKTIPRHGIYLLVSALMHSKYQLPSIQLYVMDLKFMEQSQNQMTPGSEAIADKAQGSNEIRGVEAETTGSSDDNGNNNVVEESHQQTLTKLKEGNLSEWEARRYGSMAARLLRDVRIA